ncbi:DUF5384 family protein [Lichenicoccus sp.]|uniref:DUF5384 family protein n=1 Tax=Lichenicoccus sp. TaxID=2781899 RepID=UPI003D0D9DCD
MEIQQETLHLQAEKNLVARENEYIDRDLAQKSADTDVTRSLADSNRNLSLGMKTLLEKTGDAEVTQAAQPSVRTSAPPRDTTLTADGSRQ